jgi:hypothetical protein
MKESLENLRNCNALAGSDGVADRVNDAAIRSL